MNTDHKKFFFSRLSFIQARNCVLVAFIVGMVLSAAQIALDYAREKDAVDVFANEILAASRFAAADATFHLDAPAAQEVAKGILQYYSINSVTIINEEGLELAHLSVENPAAGEGVSEFKLFGALKTYTLPLQLVTGELVGRLTIAVDPAMAAESFVDRSIFVIASGIVRNILLSFILIFVFHYTITSKLIGISSRLANLDIKNPDNNRIPEDNFKTADELQGLARSINGMLGIIASDIEERELREKELLKNETELAYQANHDLLTGLVNRRGFDRHLQNALKNSRIDHAEHVLCYLDLDQFKVINDTCGHIAGDELLRQVSKVLTAGVRKHDVLARLGGDEFGILIEDCDLEHAYSIAEKLCQKVDDFRFEWDGRRFSLGVSIGIVPITQTDGSITELLKKADVACYAAKSAGRHCVRIYQANNEEFTVLHGEMEWVAKINQALEDDRFELYAQTIAPVIKRQNQGLHFEVLIRMIDGDKVVAPGTFLPAAEHYNLISKLDRWVVSTLFRYLGDNPRQLAQLSLCSINLSGQSMNAAGFQSFIIEKLDSHNIPAHKICFEITETAAISNLTAATRFIEALRNKGCQFALDDFGTGLSSFAYLKNLAVDYLKIDGVFIKDIVDDPIDYAMVKSIHEVGHVMGMKTVAEFVENDQIRGKLRDIGVDYAQGYGISLPIPLTDLVLAQPCLLAEPAAQRVDSESKCLLPSCAG